jgi:hypothetical protein
VRDIVWPRAELIVWLDYSLVRIYARLLRRTTRRVLTHEELWAGNRQRAGEAFFSGSALSFWTTRLRRNRAAHRGGCLADLARPEHAHLTVFRARSPREVETFVRGLAGRAQRAARNVGREGVAWQ